MNEHENSVEQGEVQIWTGLVRKEDSLDKKGCDNADCEEEFEWLGGAPFEFVKGQMNIGTSERLKTNVT